LFVRLYLCFSGSCDDFPKLNQDIFLRPLAYTSAVSKSCSWPIIRCIGGMICERELPEVDTGYFSNCVVCRRCSYDSDQMTRFNCVRLLRIFRETRRVDTAAALHVGELCNLLHDRARGQREHSSCICVHTAQPRDMTPMY
jgi:hypothetical protein